MKTKVRRVNNKDVNDDINGEASRFMRTIDCARIRGYDIQELLACEIASKPFYLFKDGLMKKPQKAQLMQEMKALIGPDDFHEYVPDSEKPTMIVFDFMAYARKVPLKKLKISSYSELFNHLWQLFKSLGRCSSRIDIIFDLYLEQSIKGQERGRREKTKAIDVSISDFNQHLPVNIESFWPSAINKMQLQGMFIQWVCEIFNEDFLVFLGGAVKSDITSCIRILEETAEVWEELKCTHEEADDRILYHVNHGVAIQSYKRVVIASPDTDVFTNAIYHYSKWKYAGLEELWVIGGRAESRQAVPVYKLESLMDPDVVDILPAVHALTGCDTTSKVGTKHNAFQVALECGGNLLNSFGIVAIDEDMITKAEIFLVKCFANKSQKESFNELRYEIFHQNKFKLDLEKFPPSSSSIRMHILRSYYQSRLWYNAPFEEDISLLPTNFGYQETDDGLLQPIVLEDSYIPEDFPIPCSCKKCARDNVCICRKLSIACCEYCGCKQDCSNPFR